jgi:hypothetical protein
MTARIFISYRTADGVDKATALARDLGEIFGDETVFLDKDDLRGGSAWRKEIHSALDAKPILLLLVTPLMLSALDEQGQPRIADTNDPVRRELQGALEAGASIIPILCDGLDETPDSSQLPPPFDCIGELTWRRLRAYDWENDIERLVDDLKALGISPIKRGRRASDAPPTMAHFARSRRVVITLLSLLAAIVAITAAWWLSRDNPANNMSGTWQAQLWQGEQTVIHLVEKAGSVSLTSEPIAVTDRADWADYRTFWRERGSGDLTAIQYRGEGKRLDLPGAMPTLDIALQVVHSPTTDGDRKSVV